ncbi:MAG: carboxy terminal-processing peptidase [Wenzhouxiangellaceae bacterium]|nr:carboxy terminal-processing peptidase [Wenzhouxiangellaceae bacterium]
MKKTLTILIPLAFVLAAALPVARAVPEEGLTPLEPSVEHRFATRLASRFLTSYHYQRKPLDDGLSSNILDQYLKLLDPNRMYFLQEDIEDFQRFRDQLDDSLRTAELAPAFEIFNRYRERVAERIEHARSTLDTEFDFTVDERYQFDRTEAPWAADRTELDEIWRKRVKNDWLNLKLAEREIDDIRTTLDDRYRNIAKRIRDFESQDAFQFFMNAYARSIEPHSSYMSPRSAENFEISMKLSLDGIGALLSSENEYVEIQEIVPGGPADLDGRLQSGDRIIGVGQGDEPIVDVVGWRLDDVVDLIRGERETKVRLEILPAETGVKGPPEIIDIVRNEVKLEEQAAQAHVEEFETEGETRRIGVIQIPVFYVDFKGRARNEPDYRSSTRDVRNLIQDLRQQDVDGIVIDLRNNGGGALIEATTMTGLFIDEGPVVQIRDSSGRVTVESDQEPGMAWDGPLAVLVNRASASASEIFAAAIQDYGRGIIIGEPTFGKGTVQNLYNLDNYAVDDEQRLGQVKLTMAKFFRVDGGSTQSRGVTPDIRLPTYGDASDYGEAALDFHMEWSEIDETDYRPLADLDPLLPAARELHEARRETDEELKSLIEDYEHFGNLGDRVSVSLLETERLAEQEESERRRRERYADAGDEPSDDPATDDPSANVDDDAEDEERPDILLRESARILADLIALDDGQQRLVQAPEPDDLPSPN